MSIPMTTFKVAVPGAMGDGEEAKSRPVAFFRTTSPRWKFLTDVDAGKSGTNDKRCRVEARRHRPPARHGDGRG